MFILNYSDAPPKGCTFEFDARTGMLQMPDGTLQTAEIIVPDLKGDAPFCEFGDMMVVIVEGKPHFSLAS